MVTSDLVLFVIIYLSLGGIVGISFKKHYYDASDVTSLIVLLSLIWPMLLIVWFMLWMDGDNGDFY